MVDAKPGVLPLRIRLSSMSRQSRQLLEYHFSNAGAAWFKQVRENEAADCIAVDLDYPGTKTVLTKHVENTTEPFLVFSFVEYLHARVVNLIKPLSQEKLNTAAIEMANLLGNMAKKKEIDTATADKNNKASPLKTSAEQKQVMLNWSTPEPAPKKISDAEIDRQSSHSEKTESSIIEQMETISSNVEKIRAPSTIHAHTTFHEDNYLSGYLRKALKQADLQQSAFSICLPSINIFILPREDRVFTNKSLKDVSTAKHVYSRLDPDNVKTKYFTDHNKSVVAGEIQSSKGFVYALEAFSWRSSLLSARGRIPHDFDPSAPIRLNHWPNFTRLENTPHCFEVAALWSSRFASLDDVVTQLDVPVKYVVAFFNGAYALGLFENEFNKTINMRHAANLVT